MSPLSPGGLRSLDQQVDGLDRWGLLHRYDATRLGFVDGEAVREWRDVRGDHDLAAVGDPTYNDSGINSHPTVRFDGASYFESPEASSGLESHTQQPGTLFFVVELSDATTDDRLFHNQAGVDGGSDIQSLIQDAGNGDWVAFAGSYVIGGTPDTNPHIITVRMDGPDTTIRVDGAQVASGDAGDDAIRAITLGASNSGNEVLQGELGEVGIYTTAKTDDELRGGIEEPLSDKWDINLA